MYTGRATRNINHKFEHFQEYFLFRCLCNIENSILHRDSNTMASHVFALKQFSKTMNIQTFFLRILKTDFYSEFENKNIQNTLSFTSQILKGLEVMDTINIFESPLNAHWLASLISSFSRGSETSVSCLASPLCCCCWGDLVSVLRSPRMERS